jgi:hypothetical protein
LTVQGARIVCTHGYLDLALDMPGYREVTEEGIVERNPLFRNFEADSTVTGYGISRPGRLFEQLLAHRNGQLSAEKLTALRGLFELGFWTTVVCEAAEQSLARGTSDQSGAVHGIDIDVATLLAERLGQAAARYRDAP